jgi:hypothetical protein
MHERRTLGRREFTVASAMAVLSGVAITVTGCGGGSGSGGSPTAPSAPAAPAPGAGADKVGTVSSNHGHSAVITGAALTAAGALSLDITGTADHPHTVTLSADEVQQIAAAARVSKDSSTDASHSHTVTFN